jgi:hypothetical protein
VLPPGGCIMNCDAVLLTGSAIVNEAMLTGKLMYASGISCNGTRHDRQQFSGYLDFTQLWKGKKITQPNS